MKNTIKNFFTKSKAKVQYALAVATMAVTGITASAGPTIDSDNMMKNLFNEIAKLVTYAGLGLLVWGVIQFFMSLKNEDSEAKSRALLTVITGVGLIGIRAIITAVTGW